MDKALKMTRNKNPFSQIKVLNWLSFMQKNLIVFIPIAMLSGFLYGYLFDAKALKPYVIPTTFLMVFPMMVTMNVKKLFKGKGVRLLLSAQLINFIVIPFIGYLIGLLFFADSLYVRIGLLLITLIPTSGMTITWTGIAKGNVNEAIRMTISGLLMGALLTPIYLSILLGQSIEIPTIQIFRQIVIVVFIPMVLGFLLQQFLIKQYGGERFQKQIKTKFPPFSTLGILVIVFIAMALKSKAIVANPTILLGLILPVIILYLSIFFISMFIGKMLFSKTDTIALVYGTAMRNLSIALAIAMTVFNEFGSTIAIVITIAFIVQVQMAVWYVKISNKRVK